MLGAKGESAVASKYIEHGYEIVDRNWRCREGELDIVATKANVVVFCEVKTRSRDGPIDPRLAVGWKKQSRVRKAALRWLATQDYFDRVRFDVGIVVAGKVSMLIDAF